MDAQCRQCETVWSLRKDLDSYSSGPRCPECSSRDVAPLDEAEADDEPDPEPAEPESIDASEAFEALADGAEPVDLVTDGIVPDPDEAERIARRYAELSEWPTPEEMADLRRSLDEWAEAANWWEEKANRLEDDLKEARGDLEDARAALELERETAREAQTDLADEYEHDLAEYKSKLTEAAERAVAAEERVEALEVQLEEAAAEMERLADLVDADAARAFVLGASKFHAAELFVPSVVEEIEEEARADTLEWAFDSTPAARQRRAETEIIELEREVREAEIEAERKKTDAALGVIERVGQSFGGGFSERLGDS